MLARLSNWLDHRTGYRRIVSALLIENIPGGAKWRYVWGSCLLFVFSIQLITGLLLMTAYSPSAATAWSSVYYIQYEMDFGWFIRGLHHFGSQTMVVLIAVHMLQVVIAGAHLPPREINWWLGLGLLGAVFGLSLTGYLLPWDQKGYWATQVSTNIAGNLPGAGSFVQKVAVGGTEYGHHTLSRFYTLHVGILPPLVIGLTILHMYVFRRHGVTHARDAEHRRQGIHHPEHDPKKDGWFWPDQAFRDLVVGLLIFGAMVGLVLYGHGHKQEVPASAGAASDNPEWYNRIAHAGRDGRGANLDAPANPSSDYPARPEWYFLFLFQLLKYFEGEQELIGTVIIPNGVMVVLALLPLLGYGRMRWFGHAVGVLVVVGLLGGTGGLTYLALKEDQKPTQTEEQAAAMPDGDEKKQVQKAIEFHKQLEAAEAAAYRAIQLAYHGVPAHGAADLLARDPVTAGRKLFEQNCAVCHTHGKDFKNDKPTASDLAGFGSEEWIYRLLCNPGHPDFFGRTKLAEMAEAIEGIAPTLKMSEAEQAKLDEADKAELEKAKKDFRVIAKWLASRPGRDGAATKTPGYAEGLKAFRDRTCHTCHSVDRRVNPKAKAPSLFGYGDAEWLRLMIMAPHHPARYGANNAMPIFRDLDGPASEVFQQEMNLTRETRLAQAKGDEEKKKIEASMQVIHLSDIQRELILRWLLKDDRLVFGGDPVAAPPRKTE